MLGGYKYTDFHRQAKISAATGVEKVGMLQSARRDPCDEAVMIIFQG